MQESAIGEKRGFPESRSRGRGKRSLENVVRSFDRAKNVLAMDDGGTSDPFTEIRFRGLQNVSRTIEKTCDPEWEQTFTFNIPNGKRVLDASDAVELYVYDRDQALNDFIGYAKLDLEGEEVQDEESMKLNRKKMSSAWKRVDSASEGGLIVPSTKLLNESFESENGESSSLGISKDKKPIPPVATKVRYDKHTGKKYTQNHPSLLFAGKPTTVVLRRESFERKADVLGRREKVYRDNHVRVLVRVETRRGISSIRAAEIENRE